MGLSACIISLLGYNDFTLDTALEGEIESTFAEVGGSLVVFWVEALQNAVSDVAIVCSKVFTKSNGSV